jgi:uncharacterized protein (DUF362 family)
VFACLDRLDAETGAGKKLKGKRALVKPNLVMVFSGMGMTRKEYPETMDPRVLDAVLLWTLARASAVTIVESSGRGSPTRVAFAASGIGRMARHRGCGLVALEEEPCDRYILPRASVQKEILIPRIFSSVIAGETCYISLPKLKTNLYTQVTLGFKNAMGVIPYNLRQRNHNHAIDRKLVERLYFFKPDIVLVDGVVGGEGECPAPVDPVDSRLVIAGDQAVETDRVATRLMGFDPETIPLMRIADELGFGSPDPVRIFGDALPVGFRPADRSLLSERVAKAFPGIRVLYGIDRGGIDWGQSSGQDSQGRLVVDPAIVRRIESSCMGGCVASTRFGLAMMDAEGFAAEDRDRRQRGQSSKMRLGNHRHRQGNSPEGWPVVRPGRPLVRQGRYRGASRKEGGDRQLRSWSRSLGRLFRGWMHAARERAPRRIARHDRHKLQGTLPSQQAYPRDARRHRQNALDPRRHDPQRHPPGHALPY